MGSSAAGNEVVIVGQAMIPVAKKLPGTAQDVAARVAREALAASGLPKSSVQGLYTTPPALSGPPGFMFACQLADYLQLELDALSMVECGGATSTLAFKEAMREIQAGRIDTAIVVAVDARYRPKGPGLDAILHSAVWTQINLYGAFDGMYGIGAPIPYYAMSHQRYMHEYGVNPEEVAGASVVLRDHASKNPHAQYRAPITVEEVLESKVMCPPIHLLECSPFASGAAAVVLANADVARELGGGGARIRGFGEWHHPSNFAPLRGSITSFESAVRASAEAYETAGITASDVDVAEVYGVFAATELILLEDLGFFDKGTAARAVAEGRIGLDGSPAVDTSGGRLSLGHPAGTTPMMELCEVTWQLRGEAGERQVRDAELGLVHAEHGMLNGSMVYVLERFA